MTVYLLTAILGVAVVVASIWALGGARTAVLASPGVALTLMRRDHGVFSARETELSTDGTTALLRSDDGAIGLVVAMGEHFATRTLQPGDLTSAAMGPGAALELGFADLGWSHLRIGLASADRARLWHEWIAPLVDPGGRESGA